MSIYHFKCSEAAACLGTGRSSRAAPTISMPRHRPYGQYTAGSHRKQTNIYVVRHGLSIHHTFIPFSPVFNNQIDCRIWLIQVATRPQITDLLYFFLYIGGFVLNKTNTLFPEPDLYEIFNISFQVIVSRLSPTCPRLWKRLENDRKVNLTVGDRSNIGTAM